ncbi:unnamed protein product [Ectocarpus fasciculatus]
MPCLRFYPVMVIAKAAVRWIQRPDPNVLLFRRALGTNPATGEVDPEMERAAIAEYAASLAANRR